MGRCSVCIAGCDEGSPPCAWTYAVSDTAASVCTVAHARLPPSTHTHRTPHTAHAHNHAGRLRGERTEPPSWEIHCGPPYASRFLMRISGPLPGQTFDRAGLDTLRLRVQPQRAVGGNHPSGLMASRRCSGSPTYRDLTRESCVVPYPAQPAQTIHQASMPASHHQTDKRHDELTHISHHVEILTRCRVMVWSRDLSYDALHPHASRVG